ncbi:MAG: PrsW family intramembrane metalloprotease [Myxococcales bacterium]|nr:MAG: PrsW family intramembrane metalloprotease [Myxococcales bacterium]
MEKICCVCNKPLEDADARELGGRFFCEKHHQRAFNSLASRWGRMGLFEIAFLAILVAAVAWFWGTEPKALNWPATLSMALVPALIWMNYIYRLDRVEPEPLSLVMGVFLLGGLLSHGVGHVLIHNAFGVESWRYIPPFGPWISAVAVIGVVQQLCVYIAVRYTVYFTREFDEPLDGVVYATAAGLGIATISNIEFAVRAHGMVPYSAAVAMASHSLIHVAASTILGYGMARARFWQQHKQLWVGGTFLISALVNGGFKHLSMIAGIQGGDYKPWMTLAVSASVAALVLIAIDIITARLSVESFSGIRHDEGPHPKRSYDSFRAPRFVDPLLWVAVLVPLIAAASFRDYVAIPSKDISFLGGKVHFELPARWTVRQIPGGFHAEQSSLDQFGPSLTVTKIPLREQAASINFLRDELALVVRKQLNRIPVSAS